MRRLTTSAVIHSHFRSPKNTSSVRSEHHTCSPPAPSSVQSHRLAGMTQETYTRAPPKKQSRKQRPSHSALAPTSSCPDGEKCWPLWCHALCPLRLVHRPPLPWSDPQDCLCLQAGPAPINGGDLIGRDTSSSQLPMPPPPDPPRPLVPWTPPAPANPKLRRQKTAGKGGGKGREGKGRGWYRYSL